jgi:hypothetical protein
MRPILITTKLIKYWSEDTTETTLPAELVLIGLDKGDVGVETGAVGLDGMFMAVVEKLLHPADTGKTLVTLRLGGVPSDDVMLFAI